MEIHSPPSARRARLDWSASHWLHLALALAASWLYLIGGAAQSDVAGLRADFPLERLHYPVWIDAHEAHSRAELMARVAAEPVGHAVEFRYRTPEGEEIERTEITRAANTSFHNLVTRINGLFFLAVSLVVFAPRVDKIPARDLFWACLLYGLAVMIGDVYPPHGDAWPGAALPMLRILSLVVLPTLMLHVGLTFPRRAAVLDAGPWLMPLVALLGVILATWHFASWLRWFEGVGDWSDITWPRRLSGLFLAIVFGAGCLGLVLGSRKTDAEREREQAKWVLWGIAMGGAPFVFLYGLPTALTGEPVIPIEVARLFSIVIPLAFSLAVIRHKFLDVDIIIRRSLIYVLLASMMVGIYALIGIFVGHRVEATWPRSGPFVPIVATLVAVLLFTPTRRGIALLIDRVFFKIRYTYAQALNAFMKELRGATDQQMVAERLLDFLEFHLGARRIAVALQHENRVFTAGPWPEGQPASLRLHGDEPVVAWPGSTARPEIEAGDFPRALHLNGFVVAQEIRAEGLRIGVVALGEKRTGRSYVAEDLDLLAAVARETSIRVQRMNLEQDFVDEVVARHRSEEMSRFRTQFFAQFAHDLRSPLTSINWGARNLLDGVVGEVSDAQRSYLEGIESSARQLVRLVNNLLEVTRLESGLPEVEFGPVDLTELVAESVSKLRATAQTASVELVVDAPESGMVSGNHEKLLEIVDNLIENAIRYSPPHSRVDVRIERDRGLRLVVEDRGPGVDPAEIDAIFEPYRQGTPSPHSSQHGFGLGLFVVRSWTEKMGGTVSVENRSDGGARFTVHFPEEQESIS